jgi:DNA-binding MurR/RpiR family transcriptional regulator
MDVLILLTLDPRPRILRSILMYARTTRMKIVTITDHAYLDRALRLSDVVIPCHVANYGIVPTHATILTILRLLTISFAGQYPEKVQQRIDNLDAIIEELDLME